MAVYHTFEHLKDRGQIRFRISGGNNHQRSTILAGVALSNEAQWAGKSGEKGTSCSQPFQLAFPAQSKQPGRVVKVS